jgi:hypothetical protein
VLKKAGVVAAAAAGLMLLGAPAFASTAHASTPQWDQPQAPHVNGLVNVGAVDVAHNIEIPICVTNPAVGVLGVAVSALNPTEIGKCATADISNNDSHN